VDASLSLRLLVEGDRSERLAPRNSVAGPLTRSLRPERVGGDLWRGSTPGRNFALATSSLSGVLITRQRRNRDFSFEPSPAGSTPREPRKE
jgi:hypothetical protein